MAKNNVADLLSVGSLFTTQAERDEAQRETVRDIPLEEISDFPNHPFKVRMDASMMEMVDSVKQYGVLVPALVRPKPEGGYEMIAGHRRRKASELAEKQTLSWLDRHLQQAERGIRFINPNYKELFRIPDGDKVRITYADGEKVDRTCRYIDDYHVEIGSGWNSLLHICQFAEMMEQNGSTVIPLRSSLPEQCYSVLPDTGELIIIKKGESGYYRTDIDMGSKAENRALADEYNAKSGISKAQEQAMSAGSMFGWAVPAADPKNYDESGQPIRPKHRDRGDAR